MSANRAELIREHPHTHVRTPDGIAYVPRTYAQPSSNGGWEAWLEFHPAGGRAPVLRTDRETTQATRDAIEVWAAGLETAYFEGAFARARMAIAQRTR